MDQVWAAGGPVRIREVAEGIRADRPVAFTTVQTVMENLFHKGWLTREKEGRAYRYTATSPREEYTARLLSEALETTTDRGAAFSRLLERMEPDEVAELQQALARAKRRAGRAAAEKLKGRAR